MTASAAQIERIEKKLDTLLQGLGLAPKDEVISGAAVTHLAGLFKTDPQAAKRALKDQNQRRSRKS